MSVDGRKVKNLIKVFQLETIDKVELEGPQPPLMKLSNDSMGTTKGMTNVLGTIKTVATLGTRHGTKKVQQWRTALVDLFPNPPDPPHVYVPTPTAPTPIEVPARQVPMKPTQTQDEAKNCSTQV